MSDLISREDAINAVAVAVLDDKDELEAIKAIPSAKGGDADMTVIPEGTGLMTPCPDNGADLISRQDAIEAVIEYWDGYAKPLDSWDVMNQTRAVLETLPSAEAEPKWNCTANFVAEQLEKLKDMTDEERIKLLHILFPSADAEPSLKAIKRQIDEHWYLDPPSDEAVQGEWQMCEDFDGEYGICSVCGEDADFSHYGKPYNFCPNCGTRMKGGGSDEID